MADESNASPATAATVANSNPGNRPAGYTLTFDNLNCRITTSGLFSKEKKIMHSLVDASGFAKPGESLAILGPSGAGKTTLLDMLSQRKSVGELQGEILVNGEKPDAFYKKRLGHVASTMTNIPTMTARETLMFAAECRMPREATKEERIARVDEVIAGLKLTDAQNTPVGDELIRGLSSGEKRRTEVAIEMIARPRMLFLDEPTSGLDDFGARFTMELILKFVKSENVCVIVVIHQPSEAVFRLFDNCMIICNGRTCYFGPASTADGYFAGMGHPVPRLQNPIEHFLDVCSADALAAADFYSKSELAQNNLKEVARLKTLQYQPVRYSKYIVERTWLDQIKLVGHRTLLRYWRNPSTSWGRLFLFTILGLLFGIIFYQLGNNTTGMRNRLGVATTFTFLAVYVAIAAVPQFLEDRELYLQELDAAFYVTVPYWLTYFIIESSITSVITTIQILTIWPMAGFPWDSFGKVYAMMFVQFWLSTAVSQAWAAWCKTLVQAYTALWAFALVFYAFSGAVVPLGTLSPALRWLADINYWRWCLQYVIWQIMKDYIVECVPTASTAFALPAARAFSGALSGGLVANASNAADVQTFWTGVASLHGNRIASAAITDNATIAELLANSNAIATSILPVANGTTFGATPLQYTRAILSYDFYLNASTAVAEIGSNPAAFSPGFMCPFGQGIDFIRRFRDITPENPAATDAAFGVNVALLTFFSLMTLTGLMYSRNYRRR